MSTVSYFPKCKLAPRWRWWAARILGEYQETYDPEEGCFFRYSVWRGVTYVHECTFDR